MSQQKLHECLNKQVANWTVLYTKIHHFHWYVKGHHFFSLHEKFEELYHKADEYIDVLAERLLAIEGEPVSTLKGALELASINEAESKDLSAEEMVTQLVSDFKQVTEDLSQGIELAGDLNDQPTEDMFISAKESIQKDIWMLTAYIGR